MSGRGKASGRGRGGGSGLTFSLESIGYNRGDALPPPTLHPPALYPAIDLKPAPLSNTEVDDYLVTLKQELRSSICNSIYFVNPLKAKPKIERYSDKYENIANRSIFYDTDVQMDPSLFPAELNPDKKGRKSQKRKIIDNKSIDNKLAKLTDDKEDNLSDNKSDDDDKDDDENKDAEENASDEDKDAEDVEEGTDYTFSYFDNGESYLDDSEDNLDEGPTY